MHARNLFVKFSVFTLLILTACSGNPANLAEDASPSPIPPAATATQPAPTPEPSPTPEPTALPSLTLVPTATPVPSLALVENGLSGWCVSMGDPNAASSSADVKPDSAVDIVTANGQVNVIGEFSRCFIFITFNQPMPAGALVKFYDGNNGFYQTALQPMSTNTNTGWALVDHTYTVNPPAWELFFRLDVVGADGMVFYSSPYHVARGWTPTECWNGALPNPLTLKCPLRQDLHPWDVGYGEY